MKRNLFAVFALSALASVASAATVLQEDFTPAQVGTLPSSLTGSFDSGTDVSVVTFGTMSPAIAADHSGGDGHVLRVGDINTGGGAWNWAYPTTALNEDNVSVQAWVYISHSGFDGTPAERDYLLMLRLQNANPMVTGTAAGVRQGYFFAITANSSWSGITPNPANNVPIIFKQIGSTHTRINEGTTPISEGWHLLKAQAVGNNLEFYVDGSLVASGTDNSYATGNVAIGYYEDNGGTSYPHAAAYDNLLVESQDPASVSEWSIYE